jgi:ribosomal protein S18 acetylase RimI-like enzyme
MLRVRAATTADVDAIASMLREYMKETFGTPWYGSPEALVRDGLGSALRFVIAEAAGEEVVAFVAWQSTYDLHHCVSGAEVMDLYVAPRLRGRAVALLLLVEVAAQAEQLGGKFIKGQAITKPGVRELYDRVAMSFPGADCIVGGRAFRALAELAGRPPRFVVKNMPDRAWNHEA